MKHQLFYNDAWAYRDTPSNLLDPRLKLILAGGCLAALFWSSPSVSLIIFASALVGVKVNGYPWSYFAVRMIFPAVIAIFYLVSKAMLVGQTVFLEIHLGSWQLVLFIEGLNQGVTTALRIIAAVSVVILLSLTTSIAQFLRAASWCGVPAILLELLMLVYHYIFVLWQEAVRIYQAQQLRLGHEKLSHSFLNMTKLMAFVVVKALERAESAAQAMELRGYDNTTPAEVVKRGRRSKWS